MMKRYLCISTLLLSFTISVLAQSSCTSTFAKTIGSALSNEGGNSIAVDDGNNILYVAGFVSDSTLLMKINADGDILWSRTFDVIKKQSERVAGVILDSDGMIVIAGMTDLSIGGRVYVMKYNPNIDQILWANQYISHSNNFGLALIEKGSGGNYLVANNPTSPNDAELLEIDRNTGVVNPNFSKHYHLGSAETLQELVYHNGGLYATGRFTDGGATSDMRNVLMSLNPDNGLANWTKLGHRSSGVIARLYGTDLVIDQDQIYSISHGDPDGATLGNEEMYVQKTSLSGQVEWLRRYNLPVQDDVTDEIISTSDGFIIMGRSRGPSDIYLFKINHAGDVLWARTYDFAENDNTYFGGGTSSQVAVMDNALYFTAYAEQNGRRDMILVKTDSEGRVNDACLNVKSMDILVTTITDGVFYDVEPTIFTFVPEVISLELTSSSTPLQIENTCVSSGDVETTLDESICKGESFEGYTLAGTYLDTFSLASGCDSIRILNLRLVNCDPFVVYNLNACTSYMSNGTNMDYSEFLPMFPPIETCASVTAGNLYRSPPQENKHSCTPGLNNTSAMCVSSLEGCNFIPGDQASVIMEVTITPNPNSIFQVTGIEFSEKAPLTYDWIDGGTGSNNYPTLFGIRILKNGTEIFSDPAVPTSLVWSLHHFDFTDDTLFEVVENTIFRIELLPYCPVGNGAIVAAWDLEDIVIYGGCVREPALSPSISGVVRTASGKPVIEAEIHLSSNFGFSVFNPSPLSDEGTYIFNNLQPGLGYYLRGFHNTDFLNGVSTLDLILIQKHLLGITPFTSLDQYVAADVNRDNHVNVFDLITLRKTLLGYTAYFPGNTSWRFGLLPQSMESTDPSTLEEINYIESLQAGPSQADFLGIKIGDLNDDVIGLTGNPEIEIRTKAVHNLSIEDHDILPGVPFTIHIKSMDATHIEGLQLGWQINDLVLIGIEPHALSVTEDHIAVLADGSLRLSWISDRSVSIKEGDLLFDLTFVSTKAEPLSGLVHQIGEVLSSEIYAYDQAIPVELNILPQQYAKKTEVEFFTVTPNPFTDNTTIRFQLAGDHIVRIHMFDASGRKLYTKEIAATEGNHIVQISPEDISQHSGLLFCQLICDGYVEVRKVIRMK